MKECSKFDKYLYFVGWRDCGVDDFIFKRFQEDGSVRDVEGRETVGVLNFALRDGVDGEDGDDETVMAVTDAFDLPF